MLYINVTEVIWFFIEDTFKPRLFTIFLIHPCIDCCNFFFLVGRFLCYLHFTLLTDRVPLSPGVSALCCKCILKVDERTVCSTLSCPKSFIQETYHDLDSQKRQSGLWPIVSDHFQLCWTGLNVKPCELYTYS